MSLALAIASFFIIWWTAFFIVLPFGVRTQGEEHLIVPGSSESAPARPRLLRKVLQATLLALVIFAIFYWIMAAHPFTLDDIPFLPRF